MIDEELLDLMTRNEADMAFKKRVRTVFEWIDPQDGDRILDIPCGRGFYINMLRYAFEVDVVGADLDWSVMEKAQANLSGYDRVQLNHASIYSLPYAANTFDSAIASEILEHLDDDVGGLREILRVLKPGGVVAITVPNADYPFWWDPINRTLQHVSGKHIQHGPFAGIWANHVRLYTRQQLRQAVIDAGFIVEEERAFTHNSFPFIHNLVYGFGMPLLESGLLPDSMATAANRITFEDNDGSLFNPINFGLAVFNWFDRNNPMDEPPERSTVNLCVKGRKPA